MAFAAVRGFFEDTDAGRMVFVDVGEDAVEVRECREGVLSETAEGAGGDAAAPVRFAEPVADFSGDAMDVVPGARPMPPMKRSSRVIARLSGGDWRLTRVSQSLASLSV